MATRIEYRHLERKLRSNYQQLFVKGRNMRAEVLYRATVGTEPRSAEEVAGDYGVPVEAVQEAIDYCVRNKELLERERAMEETSIHALGLDRPPYVPANDKPAC